jgi:hypothetical protein
MLKEEKELRYMIRKTNWMGPLTPDELFSLITALVRAVREDCAKVAEGWPHKLRDKKDFRNLASLDIAAAIREGK